jgi:hypothetical protein
VVQKVSVLWILAISVVIAAGLKPDRSPGHPEWRLTDESSCAIETAGQLTPHTTLQMSVGKRVANIKDIKVQGLNSETPLEVWRNAAPLDSRSVTVKNQTGVRIALNLSGRTNTPVRKHVSPDTVVLVCSGTRLSVRASR